MGLIRYAFVAFIIFLFFVSISFRIFLRHPFRVSFYGFRDFIAYFRYKKWRLLQTGQLICYCALFGRGKTLSVVHYIVSKYRAYNNTKVFDPFRKKWVTQKVHVISNVDLNIPFERFVSLSQIISAAERFHVLDEENDTLTNILVLGDEFSVQLNSRQFKSNIDPLFLNTLLTCRHHHITIVYDAQRFNHVDALLRQVTSYVVSCNKMWRFVIWTKYDAWELENASDPQNVRPISKSGFFATDKDFEAYDTLACVGNLSKSCKEGDMLSEKEILDLQQETPQNMDLVHKPSRYWKRYQKKHKSLPKK